MLLAGACALAGCGSGAAAVHASTVAAHTGAAAIRPASGAVGDSSSDGGARVRLLYRARATAAAPVDAAALERVIAIMRRRLDELGLAQTPLRRVGADEIELVLPVTHRASRAREVVGRTANLDFYDWEPNVIGPAGTPAPSDPAVTGGPDAGAVRTGLPEYKAVLRAAKRPAVLRRNSTTLDPGCTPKQINGCVYGAWYLLDTKHGKMLCAGGKPVCPPQDTQADLYADGYKPLPGSKPQAVRVNPGTILVQAHPEEFNGKINNPSPNSFYVINDDPVLSGSDIRNPQQGFQENGSDLLRHGASGPPDIDFELSPSGRTAFERVTKAIAERGRNAQLPGVTKANAVQHFAIVLDEQVLTAPSIDYTRYPEGIDAAHGSQITGGFTIASARNLASELRSGALPLKLELISQSRVRGVDR